MGTASFGDWSTEHGRLVIDPVLPPVAIFAFGQLGDQGIRVGGDWGASIEPLEAIVPPVLDGVQVLWQRDVDTLRTEFITELPVVGTTTTLNPGARPFFDPISIANLDATSARPSIILDAVRGQPDCGGAEPADALFVRISSSRTQEGGG